ncbi:MAG: C25 family cysteine peptidase [Alphaproteobacteria bacterium]
MTGEYWGQWQALGSGYVGRAKVPPGMDLPVAERRLAGIPPRWQGKQPVSAEVPKTSPVSMSKTAAKGNPATPRRGRDRRLPAGPYALWLRTTVEGLHGVTVDEVATELGMRAKDIRELAGRGDLALTVAGSTVSWHFDPAADEILFAAEDFSTFHTDWNAYRLEPKGWGARPMSVQGGAPAEAGDEMPFPESLSLEKEPDLMFIPWPVADEPDADYWWWDYLYGSYKLTLDASLDIPDPAPSGTAQLRIVMRGASDLYEGDDHHVYAELNGTELQPQGSVSMDGHMVVSWDGKLEEILVVDINQGLLSPSGVNNLVLRSVHENDTTPVQFLDRVDVDYSRMPVAPAAKGMLWLRRVPAGVQAVTNFAADDIVVIESPAGDAVLREDVRVEEASDGSWSAIFETVAGSDYLVAERGRVHAPMMAVDQPSRLAHRKNHADYLIIAPRAFQGTAEELAELRRDAFTYVKIAWLEEIYDEFNFGREDPAAITRFMERVVDNWEVSPLFVMLVGKASLDQKDRLGLGDGFLPTVMTATPWTLSPSDSWLLAGGSMAPFAIGRLPITNDAEGIGYVDKLRCHEDPFRWDCRAPGDERYKALLVADDPDHEGDFHANTDVLAERLVDRLGFDQVDGLYHQLPPKKKVFFADGTMEESQISSVRDVLAQSAAWNLGYVSYDGHGSKTLMGDYNNSFIDVVTAQELENDTYPVFAALTCAVGDDTYPGTRSLAGALVLNPIGGAIAAMAPTGLSLDIDAQVLGGAFVDNLISGGNAIGAAVLAAKEQTDGEIEPFMPDIYSVVGDPAVRVIENY